VTCPTDAELLAFADGSLSNEARSSAETHLDSCPSCLAIVAALARDSASGVPDGKSARESSPATPGPLLADGAPRYVPGVEIARGGMGRILAAEDRLLGRRVALKQVRHRSEGLGRRFLREQRITARLQHPAIIPIYDAGTLEDGEPFFVMRLVKGESLDRSATAARTLEDRLRLLPAVIGVVDAVAYAHGEGVVHRDLKPQNVLVGPFGEVVVLDWGLARELDAAPDLGGDGAGVSGDEVEGSRGDAAVATRIGEVLGTLAYMAPEQAEGRVADARSDVYGLGAILYHVLTGAPPHAGRAESLSSGAARHAPRPLAGRVPDAPPDLVAIVERAMAADPEARYASAQQLAEDLKRWQAGRLVEAHRYTPGELLRRFVRRYRAPLLVAVASLVVLATLGGLGLRRIVAERARALAEQARAETARGRAEAQRIAAETLVGFILGDLRSRLERVGRLDALEGVARAVIAYQDGSPASEDAATSLRRSVVAGLAGDVAFAIGNLDAADESYARSRETAEGAGDGDAVAQARCRADLRLGDVRKRRGALDAATTFYEGCAALTRDKPGAAFEELSVRSRISLAEMARIRGDLPSSRRILEEGRAVADALVKDVGGPGADASRLLFQLRNELSQTLFLMGEVVAARDVATAAVDIARARRAARPDDADARYDVAVGLTLLGLTEQTSGDLVAPEARYREALAEHRVLVARDPANAQWQRAIGVDADRMGSLMKVRGDAKAALPWFRESDAASVRVAAIAPGNLEWQRDLFISAMALGDLLMALGNLDEARAEVQRAVDVQERLMAMAPDTTRVQRDLSLALMKLGEVELKAGRIEPGHAAIRRSIAMLKLYFATVDTPAVRQDLGLGLLTLAKSERGTAAIGYIEEAAVILEPVRALAGANPELRDLMNKVDEERSRARAGR
jgi:tetratricopeptide (TPR) repeat protein